MEFEKTLQQVLSNVIEATKNRENNRYLLAPMVPMSDAELFNIFNDAFEDTILESTIRNIIQRIKEDDEVEVADYLITPEIRKFLNNNKINCIKIQPKEALTRNSPVNDTNLEIISHLNIVKDLLYEDGREDLVLDILSIIKKLNSENIDHLEENGENLFEI